MFSLYTGWLGPHTPRGPSRLGGKQKPRQTENCLNPECGPPILVAQGGALWARAQPPPKPCGIISCEDRRVTPRAKTKNKNTKTTEASVTTHSWGDRLNPGNLHLPMGGKVRLAITYDLKCPVFNQKLRHANNWKVGPRLKEKTILWKLMLSGPRCWIYQTIISKKLLRICSKN